LITLRPTISKKEKGEAQEMLVIHAGGETVMERMGTTHKGRENMSRYHEDIL
jgi:hypothetical protein